MPVMVRDTWEIVRGRNGTPSRASREAARCAPSAHTPGHSTTSAALPPCNAGSRRYAVRRSSNTGILHRSRGGVGVVSRREPNGDLESGGWSAAGGGVTTPLVEDSTNREAALWHGQASPPQEPLGG